MIEKVKIILLALMLTVGMSYASAQWTNPPANPPAGNVPAPIHEGGSAQTKSGALGVGGLAVFGQFQYVPPGTSLGSVTPGQVLVATDANGKVGWGAASGGGVAAVTPTDIECQTGGTTWKYCVIGPSTAWKACFLTFHGPTTSGGSWDAACAVVDDGTNWKVGVKGGADDGIKCKARCIK